MILKFCILPSRSLIFLLRSFITYSAKQLALKPSLEERLGFGLINSEEEQWIEGRMGGMVQTISCVLLARTNSSFLYQRTRGQINRLHRTALFWHVLTLQQKSRQNKQIFLSATRLSVFTTHPLSFKLPSVLVPESNYVPNINPFRELTPRSTTF